LKRGSPWKVACSGFSRIEASQYSSYRRFRRVALSWVMGSGARAGRAAGRAAGRLLRALGLAARDCVAVGRVLFFFAASAGVAAENIRTEAMASARRRSGLEDIGGSGNAQVPELALEAGTSEEEPGTGGTRGKRRTRHLRGGGDRSCLCGSSSPVPDFLAAAG